MVLPKPRINSSQKAYLEARDQYGRYCQAYCFNGTSDRYMVCQPELTLSVRAQEGANISYSHSMVSRRYLDVDLSAHPSRTTVYTPNIVFTCTKKAVHSDTIKGLGNSIRPSFSTGNFAWMRATVLSRSTSHADLSAVQIEVYDEEDEHFWRSSILQARSSFDPNIVFLRVKNPLKYSKGVLARIAVWMNGTQDPCEIKCAVADDTLRDCDGVIFLHSDASQSNEQIFTADQSLLEMLGWNMLMLRSSWRRIIRIARPVPTGRCTVQCARYAIHLVLKQGPF